MASNAITSPTYDPITTAQNLATKTIASQQAMLNAQSRLANDTSNALNNLKTAMSAFQSSMTALSSGKSVLSQAATFSNTAFGSATAGAAATAGSYSFFVEQIATAHQMSYGGLSSSPAAASGALTVKVGGPSAGPNDLSFAVDLSAADQNGDGTLTPQEMAAAINHNAANNARVTASIVTIGGQSQLVLSSNSTGIENSITLDASSVTNATLKQALVTDAASNVKEVVAAKDAIVWLGAQTTGTKITQASNTLTNVNDVKMTFTKAMTAGDAPLTMTVATDAGSTAGNVQAFIDAYNKLKSVLDGLTSTGDPQKDQANASVGLFVHDSGLTTLRSNLGNALRQTIGGVSLVQYGITAARDGTLTLDSAKLTAKLAGNPGGLDTLFGKNSLSASTGVFGVLDKIVGQWSSSTKGQITQRLDATTKLQATMVTRQARLNDQYDSAYKKYLDQFSRLQILQAQMEKNVDMFDAMFGDSKS